MKPFIHDDFLLKSPVARRLFHEHTQAAPIIDYHCHLDPRDLADDRIYANIAQAWVVNDPYKHRAMRTAGVPEHFITGPASDREKFDHWARVVPMTLGNPLFHWTALELKRCFDIDEMLSPESAGRIWERCNLVLSATGARSLVAQANVQCICTSDRLLDDLAHHQRLQGGVPRVLPSLRADDILGCDASWIEALSRSTGIAIRSLDDFAQAIERRLDCFERLDCRLADHGLDDFVYLSTPGSDAARLFEQLLRHRILPWEDLIRLRSALLRMLGQAYAKRGWALQLHLGAQRQTSTRLRTLAGPAGGYAAIGRACDIPSLCRFLDDLEQRSFLPRTILYPLNPADFAPLASLTGSFAEDGVAGKIQLGPAWWYNDHQLGIRQHLDALAHYGLLWTFIGMTTDSRSILSMTRHEYFRRVLCDWIGDQVSSGGLPDDEELLAGLVRGICFDNARKWLFHDEDPS